MDKITNQSGFTLIEVLVAMVILTIGILSLYSMQISAIRGNSLANHLTTAATWNADRLEQFAALAITDAVFTDTDGDGVAGIDDSGCCAGGADPAGNAVAGCTAFADGCVQQNDYFLYWNANGNAAVPNSTSVHVIIRDPRNSLRNPMIFRYIKTQLQ